MSKPTTADGARSISVSEDEVTSVAEAPGGLIIITKDGVEYIVVPKDRPDAAGQTGVMFLVPPVLPYHGTFPVFNAGADSPELDEAAADADETGYPVDGTTKDIYAWVGEDHDRAATALEAEQARGDRARAGVVAGLGKILEATARPSITTGDGTP